jgi:hypothetical protein
MKDSVFKGLNHPHGAGLSVASKGKHPAKDPLSKRKFSHQAIRSI